MKVSEFLKLNRQEIEEYVKKCKEEPRDEDSDVNLHLTGWVPKGSIIKKSFSHGFVLCLVDICRRSRTSKIAFYSQQYMKGGIGLVAHIILKSRSGKVIRMCYGSNNAKGNRLINVPKEKSFWDPKRNKWRWEE